ncbi:MAG TPA: lipopolysaccharide biosynthesis protein [Clostridia bacterium]|nr:lipopolysaccharide biosynthesis protein [Clostridia bacterium]
MATLIKSPHESQAPGVPARSLRANVAWTLVGNVVYAACQWGMLAALAKAGSTEDVGRFALGLAIAAPVFMFTNLQLRAVQATDARGEFEFADYFSLRVVSTALGLFAVLLIVMLSGYGTASAAVILAVAAAKAIETVSDVISGLLQKGERLDLIARALILRGVSSVVLFTGVFLWTRSVVAAVCAMAVSWLAVCGIYEVARARQIVGRTAGVLVFRYQRQTMWKLAKLSLPLGVVMTLISLNVNIPRYVLERSLGTGELGIFASLAYLVTAVSLIVSALGQSASPRLAKLYADRNYDGFRRITLRLVAIGAAILAGGVPAAWIFGRPVVAAVYRPEYAERTDVLVLLAAASGIGAIGSFLGYAATAARRFRSQMPISAAVTCTTAGLAAILVPSHGLNGAALAIIAGAVVQVAGFSLSVRRALQSL